MKVVAGVGPDAPVVQNARGARQSAAPTMLNDAFPWLGAIEVGKVIQKGIPRYGKDNWRGIDSDEHLHHAMIHLAAYFAGDRTDHHAAHAACRALMALDQIMDPERNERLFKLRPGDPPLDEPGVK